MENICLTGGILTTKSLLPFACGYLDDSLVEKEAIGWFDGTGKLYQIAVQGKVPCKYEDVLLGQERRQGTLYFSIFVLIFLLFTQLVIFLLIKSL